MNDHYYGGGLSAEQWEKLRDPPKYEAPPDMLPLHRAFWEHMPADIYPGDQPDGEDTLIYCTCGEQMSYRVEFAGHMANVANGALGRED